MYAFLAVFFGGPILFAVVVIAVPVVVGIAAVRSK